MATLSPLFSLLPLLLSALLIPTTCRAQLPEKHVAFFIFGDSLFDAGNNNYLNGSGKTNIWPYGETFFRHPTGRVCDGRTVPDFIAEYAKLPYIMPYLQPGFDNYTDGVNFASAGAGVFASTHAGTIHLKLQLSYFEEVVKRLKQQLGDAEAKKLLSKAVYLFSIGGNDYITVAQSPNSNAMTSDYKRKYIGMVLGNFTTVIKAIYDQGGRKFGFQNVGPLGCMPATKSMALMSATMSSKNTTVPNCIKVPQILARLHNIALSNVLKKLATKLPGFQYSLFDYYTSLAKRTEKDVDLSVCVVEKGAEVGAHILSGNVFEPRALDELLPQWKQEEAPISVSVSSDKFWLLTKDRAYSLPCPFDNKGNYVTSLSQVVRWMGMKAEELGVEIYPGFAASEMLYDANDKVIGIVTNDMGVAKDGSKRENFQRGVELKGRITLLAEGCRGSLSEKLLRKYNLREKVQAQHQTYALGIKEVWEIDESKHEPGSVLHTVGWPLDYKTYGGSFLYHMKDNQVSIGLVVALNYHNPFLNPYEEFQKFKHHPVIKPLLEGGTVLQYGARTLNEGGFQSIPYPVFPGGAIIGCSAGFLNVPKIKGTHTAMKSGMLAAEAAFGVLNENSNMEAYWDNLRNSWIWEELYKARNYRPAFEHGLIPGLALSAVEHYILKGRSPLTLKHGKPDHEATNVAQFHSPIQYPKPDGVVSFDVPTSLYRSNTNHEHDQPAHLCLRDPKIPEHVNLPDYAGPESRYCPARVYEYTPDEEGRLKLHINAQNCIHCKACDIKDPKQNIEWTVPEGGGGPGYSIM